MATVATYVLGRKLRGRKRYPLVLMLEPLFRCTFACAGCGKIQYPPHILKKHLSLEDCLRAVAECGAPMVSIPGGEPLMHPQIRELVAGLVAQRKYVYLCTNAQLLEKNLALFTPSKYLSFSVHLDGPREEHDFAVCWKGAYDTAVSAMKTAIARGFRVTTNTTLFDGADPARFRQFFDEMMALGVEGLMISPGYSYEAAVDQDRFLHKQKTTRLFQELLKDRKKSWKFNLSPLFLELLQGRMDFECTPWGNPAYCLFGWQRPCYLLQDGYAETFNELLEKTNWENYGRKSGNPKCQNCLMHCGYEPTAVDIAFGSLKGFRQMLTAWFRY